MKKTFRGASFCALFLLLSACVSGPVQNKRAPGDLGHKTYQLRIDDRNPLAPKEFWIVVTKDQWEHCQIEEKYPECRD